MDIETFVKNNVHIAYVITFFDGINTFSSYITDYKNSNDMIISCIKELMIRKYDNYQVYIHNLSGFDANFLLKILVNLGEVKPIIHNNKIISITFKMNGYVVTFKDSQQLLISSLRSLGLFFGVETLKSIFPYSFVNENNLNYIGWVPDISYFSKISKKDYLNYCNIFDGSTWNLMNESIKYCEIDCISLYQILIKFNELIFKLFKLNIHKYPTLSSLAFAIFRSNFLKENTIPQLSGKIANEIRESYTGGAVDMYIPKPPKGEKVYCYDVNSLYPFVMKDNAMPIGKPVFFKGDIRVVDPDAFGFFYCKITSPDNLMHPILQTHVKTESGLRTIAALGQWEDLIFSAELDNAVKYGYKFEILWGYKFEKAYIFKDYVQNLYRLRQDYPKTNPLNLIAKLLLNSLYGRFGMIDEFPDITIFNNKKSYLKFIEKHSSDILDVIELGDKILVKHRSENKNQQTMLYGNLETHNVNIAIASAITAYARIHMSQFKNNPNYILYYTDTDSIYISKPLPEEMISSKVLGKMKLEYILTDAIFLAPKVYYLITETGEHIYKVKGLSHDVEFKFNDFENLLFKESWIKKIQTKWRKNLTEGNLSVLKEIYTLQVTNNKRKLIYDINNKLVITNPYIINVDKEILNR